MLKLGNIEDRLIMPEGYASSNAKDQAPPVVDSLVHPTVPDHRKKDSSLGSFFRYIGPSFQN